MSPEGLDNGFTHCFFVTFKNKADLEKYLPHPEHKKFVGMLKGVIDKVLVVDDDPALQTLFKQFLKEIRHQI